MRRKERYQYLLDYFRREMPEVTTELHFVSPFQLLVATILSAQCTDKRVNEVTPPLFEKYPDAKAMAEVEEHEVFEYVRSVSYPNSKARHLVEMAGKCPPMRMTWSNCRVWEERLPTWCRRWLSERPPWPLTRMSSGSVTGWGWCLAMPIHLTRWSNTSSKTSLRLTSPRRITGSSFMADMYAPAVLPIATSATSPPSAPKSSDQKDSSHP